MRPQSADPLNALHIGDHLALDFVNTAYGQGAAARECLVDDHSVLAWLTEAKVVPEAIGLAPSGLLALAQALRENVRALLAAAKTGEGTPAADVVNRILQEGRGTQELQWNPGTQAFQVVTRPRLDTAAGLLEPVARAVSQLLTEVPLQLVRQCEGDDCTLWFHDLTKSHRRRWCSMSLCGNRMKVAAFRSRKKGA